MVQRSFSVRRCRSLAHSHYRHDDLGAISNGNVIEEGFIYSGFLEGSFFKKHHHL